MIKPIYLLILAASLSIAAPAAPPADIVDRLSLSAMTDLVAEEIGLAQQGKLAEATRAIEARARATPDKLATADLIEAFGVQLHIAADASGDRAMMEASLRYLLRAVTGYQLALGDDDPEVAYALVRYADIERVLRSDNPSPAADAAYDEAYHIRKDRFGPAALVTLSTFVPIAELKALPSRAKGDPAAIKAATALLNQALKGAMVSKEPRAAELRLAVKEALRTLGKTETQPATRQEQANTGPDKPCTPGSTTGGVAFVGEEDGLTTLRSRADQTGVHLQDCGSSLILDMARNPNKKAVAALISGVSVGRITGVRMRLLSKPD